MENDSQAYEKGVAQLIEVVRRINAAETAKDGPGANAAETAKDGPVTRDRKMLAGVIRQLEKTIRCLEDGEVELYIEGLHHDRTEVPFKDVYWKLRELTESFRDALSAIPNANQRHALSHAAKGFLHLRNDCGLPTPTLYDGGPDVAEFRDICQKAGIVRSPEACRGALSRALEDFDPHFYGEEFSYFFQ